MKNQKISFFKIITFCIIAIIQTSFGLSASDAYANIRYTGAFDQTALYEKYKNLMQRLGCYENVRAVNKESIDQTQSTTLDIANEATPWRSDNPDDVKELEQFQQECLNLITSARKWTLITPAIGSLNNLATTSAATLIMFAFFKESLAGGFAGLNTIHTILDSFKESVQIGYNLIYKPDNNLESLEDFFAKNKCFIPHTLWEKITNEFISARQSQTSRKYHTNFIDFALGFTIYKPKPAIHCKDNAKPHEIKKEINARIDAFFKNYTDMQDAKYIKINVAKFIDILCNEKPTKQISPRYIYLYGSGGIGKTHFVQTLAQWFDELIPGSVQFQDMIVNSSYELEGTGDQPGAFLKVLRNQLINNKRSSIVMIDEATWLNDGGMTSPAKRIFNGDRSKLVTSYFGSNMDGTGVSLNMPPMLIFVASNEKITDPALESRFDIVHYPAPLQSALVDYAYNIAINSSIIEEKNLVIDKSIIGAWIAKLDPKYRNFRYIAGNTESFLVSQ